MILRSRFFAALFGAAVSTTNLVALAPALGATPTPMTTATSVTQVRYGTVKVDGLNIAYREAGDPKSPKLVLLHGWPSSSHQYRDLIVALAPRFHVIAPDYQGFGNSDRPDPATYQYSFEAISVTIEEFLAAKGFDHYGLFVQDYGGPVGFRIVGRNPKALDWMIIQNTNAYEIGFTPAWDAFRKALWDNRSAESEAPLAAIPHSRRIKGVYLAGAARSRTDQPGRLGIGRRLHAQAERTAAEPRSVLRLPDQRRTLSAVAEVPARSPAQDANLLGRG